MYQTDGEGHPFGVVDLNPPAFAAVLAGEVNLNTVDIDADNASINGIIGVFQGWQIVTVDLLTDTPMNSGHSMFLFCENGFKSLKRDSTRLNSVLICEIVVKTFFYF